MLGLPESTVVNRTIPKSKFYDKTSINSKVKDLFVKEISNITWKNKISKDTINLEPTEAVKEIEVFEINLKENRFSKDILKHIDKFIPYNILYVLRFDHKAKLSIAYKEANKNDDSKMVIDSYYESEWVDESDFEFQFDLSHDLKYVYDELIKSFIKTTEVDTTTDIKEVIKQEKEMESLNKEIEKLQKQVKKEKQFNRKVELNKILNEKKYKLEKALNA
ncbi:DUF4391 domain-containing protein [Lutibacter sp. B2]|nr:DUF4391 domain-containing protein [Lutibacter sp. B2]